MEIVKQLIAKEKAFNVIKSCETQQHYGGAKRYVEAYYEKFDDFIGYNELIVFMKNAKKTSKKENN